MLAEWAGRTQAEAEGCGWRRKLAPAPTHNCHTWIFTAAVGVVLGETACRKGDGCFRCGSGGSAALGCCRAEAWWMAVGRTGVMAAVAGLGLDGVGAVSERAGKWRAQENGQVSRC